MVRFRKDRGTGNHMANTCWNIEKAREFQKNIYFCFIDYTKAFDCVDHNKLWKILQYVSKFGKLSSGHRTGKSQFSFQSQRRAMPKYVQTTTQLYSFHTLKGNAQNPAG